MEFSLWLLVWIPVVGMSILALPILPMMLILLRSSLELLVHHWVVTIRGALEVFLIRLWTRGHISHGALRVKWSYRIVFAMSFLVALWCLILTQASSSLLSVVAGTLFILIVHILFVFTFCLLSHRLVFSRGIRLRLGCLRQIVKIFTIFRPIHSLETLMVDKRLI